jgi:hypothetical protein
MSDNTPTVATDEQFFKMKLGKFIAVSVVFTGFIISIGGFIGSVTANANGVKKVNEVVVYNEGKTTRQIEHSALEVKQASKIELLEFKLELCKEGR